MRSSIELTYKGRQLSIRALVIAGDWQIWFYEGSQRVYLYALLPDDERERIDSTLDQARRDLEGEAIVVPTVRLWPERASRVEASHDVTVPTAPAGNSMPAPAAGSDGPRG